MVDVAMPLLNCLLVLQMVNELPCAKVWVYCCPSLILSFDALGSCFRRPDHRGRRWFQFEQQGRINRFYDRLSR